MSMSPRNVKLMYKFIISVSLLIYSVEIKHKQSTSSVQFSVEASAWSETRNKLTFSDGCGETFDYSFARMR